jgi:GT2 family glycosyltransferase
MTDLAHRVSVAIPTKDRWDTLRFTLSKLEERGYAGLDTLVVDDGSATPMPADFTTRFPRVRFLRFEQSAGVCARRNLMARTLSTPFILSIDDDSFPVTGDLVAACDWLDARPKVLSLAFQICHQDHGPDPELTAKAPFPLRDFNGGGVLLKRDLVLALGGYEEKFLYYLEEGDLSMRALQARYEMWGYPAFVVKHNVAGANRNIPARVRSMLRKEALMALLYFPVPICYRRILTCVPGFLYRDDEMRPYWLQMIAGVIQGVGDYFSGRYKRRRLTPAEYRNWRNLPMASAVARNASLTFAGSKSG